MWSAGAGVEHKPPTDIVWKSQNSWGEGVNSSTTLHNSAGDVSVYNVFSIMKLSMSCRLLPHSLKEMSTHLQ